MTMPISRKSSWRAKSIGAQTVLAAAALAALGVNHAQGASLFWDADGSGTNTGGSGTWTNPNTWHLGTATGTLQNWADGNDAVFVQSVPSAAATVTLVSDVSANSLSFSNTSNTYTVSGTSTLTIGAGGILFTAATGNQQINSTLAGTNINISKTSAATATSRLGLGGTNTFTGNINMTSSTTPNAGQLVRLDLNSAGALPATAGINFGVSNCELTASGSGVTNITLGAGNAINLNSTNVGTFESFIGANTNNTLTIGGPVTGSSNLSFLTSTGGGAGVVVLNSAMTYTGPTTTFNTTATTGYVRWGINNALPVTTSIQVGANTGTFGTGAIDLAGFNQSIVSLVSGAATGVSQGITNSSGTLSTLTVTGSATTVYSSTIGIPTVGTIAGFTDNVALAHNGLGKLTLSNANTYNGGTSVGGGTLFVTNTTGSGTGTGNVTVASGATLGGSGTIAGAVSSTGKITPGVGAGTLTLGGGLTLNSGASLDMEFAPTGNDKANVTSGGLTLTGGASSVAINILDLGGIANGTYPLIPYSGGLTGAFNSLHLGTVPGVGTYQLLNDAGSIDLLITNAAASLTWSGAVNGNWDVNTTANWVGSLKFHNDDNATFDDTATGTGTITVAAGGVKPTAVTFNNASKVYTVGGAAIGDSSTGPTGLIKHGAATVTLTGTNTFSGAVTVDGGTLAITTGAAVGSASAINLSNGAALSFAGNTSTDRAIAFGTGGATLDSAFTATVSTAITGSGLLTKTGTGSITLSAPAPIFGGGTVVSAGKLVVSSVDSTGVSGVGPNTVNVNSGGTFEIANAFVGYQPDGTTPGTGLTVMINDGGTLQGTGANARISGSTQWPTAGNVTLRAPAAGDHMVTGNSIRNIGAGGQASSAVIHATGGGIVQLASGGTSELATGTQYSGTWVVAMDNPSIPNPRGGVLAVGPILTGGFGEPLNGLGYQAPTAAATPNEGYSGSNRAVEVDSGTLAFGADSRNTRGSLALLTNSYRSPLTLAGGAIASTGQEYGGGGDPDSATPVTANIHANITTAPGTTSTVRLYDPVAGAASGGRSLNFLTDPGAVEHDGSNTPVADNLTWGAGSTLVVDATGVTTGFGALNFDRTAASGTVTVGTNPGDSATLQINAGATVNLTNTMDALSGGSNYVNVLNNSTQSLNVLAGTKNVGSTDGVGKTTVSSGATLVATHVRQSNLVNSGTVQIRPSSLAAGVSKVTSLTNTGLIDISNNKLITGSAIGTLSGTTYTGVAGQIQTARNGGGWGGATGVTTSQTQAQTSNITSIGVATAAQVKGIAATATATFAGQTVSGTDTLVMYTYGGDANLDGKINVDDYTRIDFNVPLGSSGWYNGDFNYDGKINVDDYTIIDFNVGIQGPQFFTAGGVEGGAGLSGVTAVPEPTSLTLVGLGAMGLLGRRRRTK